MSWSIPPSHILPAPGSQTLLERISTSLLEKTPRDQRLELDVRDRTDAGYCDGC